MGNCSGKRSSKHREESYLPSCNKSEPQTDKADDSTRVSGGKTTGTLNHGDKKSSIGSKDTIIQDSDMNISTDSYYHAKNVDTLSGQNQDEEKGIKEASENVTPVVTSGAGDVLNIMDGTEINEQNGGITNISAGSVSAVNKGKRTEDRPWEFAHGRSEDTDFIDMKENKTENKKRREVHQEQATSQQFTGSGISNQQSTGSGNSPQLSTGSGNSPQQPAGSRNSPQQPTGSGNSPQQSIGSGNSPQQPTGSGNSPQLSTGSGNSPQQPALSGNSPQQPTGSENSSQLSTVSGNNQSKSTGSENSLQQSTASENNPQQPTASGNNPIAGQIEKGSIVEESKSNDKKTTKTGDPSEKPLIQLTQPSENKTYTDGNENGYAKSHFAEPESIQERSLHPQPESKSMDKKKKKKKKDRDGFKFPSPEDILKNLPPGANVNFINKVDTLVNGKVVQQEKTSQFQPTRIQDIKIVKVVAKVSESIGCLHGPKFVGTCWRVGKDKIITAYHVVRDNIWNDVYNIPVEQLLKDIDIDFDYVDGKRKKQFKVEERLLFYDENLDVAVLQLKTSADSAPLPPPLDHFIRLDADRHMEEEIHLIGHNKGDEKKYNYGIGLWKPTDEKMKKLEKFCQDEGYPNGYIGLDKKERVVIKCQFEGGSSGCPGIVINRNNDPQVGLIYVRGFPDFYYSQGFNKTDFPGDKLLQQGVNIFAVYDLMKTKKFHLDLMNEIFWREYEMELKNTPRNTYAITGDCSKSNNSKQILEVSDETPKNNQMPVDPHRSTSPWVPNGKRKEFEIPTTNQQSVNKEDSAPPDDNVHLTLEASYQQPKIK